MNLLLASVFTLGLLSTFLVAVLLGLMYAVGYLNIYLLFGLTILINVVMWLVGPKISDFIYRYLYSLEWITLDELYERDEQTATFLEAACDEYGFKVPKLGIIPDENPNAFTYGSDRWNARLVATDGLFTYLDENELMAVYAHELGHIQHRDFIVMTIANTLLQLIYETYMVARIAARSGGRKKGKSALLGVMAAAYLFYFVGKYVVLYLSRVREYYADQFAAVHTDPNYLSSALIKVSYGILANPNDSRLAKSTRNLGIQDFQLAKGLGLVYYNCEKLDDWQPLNKTMLYDLENPWAKITELHSTHPLTGKRIKRLCSLSDNPMFDFSRIRDNVVVDKSRMRKNFVKDVAILIIPTAVAVLFPLLYIGLFYLGYLPQNLAWFGGGWLAAIGLGIIARTLYKYPGTQPEPTTVLDMMSDLYASPVRGQSVTLSGQLIGRGVPGLIFSEDMMMQDNTGLVYLNYEHWFPFGNLFFGLTKVNDLIDQDADISGWFLRNGSSSHIGLRHLQTRTDSIRGYVKLGGLIGGSLFILIGAAIVALL